MDEGEESDAVVCKLECVTSIQVNAFWDLQFDQGTILDSDLIILYVLIAHKIITNLFMLSKVQPLVIFQDIIEELSDI